MALLAVAAAVKIQEYAGEPLASQAPLQYYASGPWPAMSSPTDQRDLVELE